MKLIRVRHKENIFYATIQDGQILCLESKYKYTEPLPAEEVELQPLVVPSKIVCVGLNYKQHAQELNMELPKQAAFFLKPPSSMIGHKETIILPENVGSIHFEGELALVIGTQCSNISVEDASKVLLGFTCANDVTARDLQKTDILMGHCKAYDTFCPIGACIETNPLDEEAKIYTSINDEIKQESLLSDMIFSPYEIISQLSHIMTFFPGDVILTGTPHNVGALNSGDTVRVEIDGVGMLENFVK